VNFELTSIDAWLRGGGLAVAASERTARSLTAAFHRARRAEGLTAWPAPNIHDWQTFVRSAWAERISDGRLVLNSIQEQSLWAEIIAAAEPQAAHLAGARDRLASLAMEAIRLLSNYAPALLNERARAGWDQDAAAFSSWLTAFDGVCHTGRVVSAARLPLELIPKLQADSSDRPPLQLAGFDRLLPIQKEFFAAWGACPRAPSADAASRIAFHAASDPSSELEACAIWCRQQLAANPQPRLLVVTQDLRTRRGEMERAFLRFAKADAFEFSLGVRLDQVALVRSASLLLHWLDGAIDEQELDWLLSSGYATAAPEAQALTDFMRAIRHRNMQRTRWSLTEFIRQRPGAELPAAWLARMMPARQRLLDFARSAHTPLEWADLVPALLNDIGWPDAGPLSSSEFQAHRRWQQAIDGCASLGFDGRRIRWDDFLRALDRNFSETLFTPESEDAPILIAGPAETAGLTADAVWFLGANEDTWPAVGTTNPLLPLAVQRQAAMPHATAQLDWDLAAIMTRRVLASAPEVHFSFARQSDGVEMRPSRLVVQLAGSPQALPTELKPPPIPDPLTVEFRDATVVPFPPGEIAGGSNILTAQSQCPFKAFAIARLGAEDWDPAEAGLTAIERGQLVHDVLHSVWAGPPAGIRSHADLVKIVDQLPSFVAQHVQHVLEQKLPSRARDAMPPRYLELEELRLINLVTEWLRYESTRVPFTVLETEQKSDASIAGLDLHLRLDRIDRLIDNSLLVIDYKTGNVTPKSWDLPRPDDVQLPLYAGFATDADESIGGLVFAKLRAGDRNREFVGRVKKARETLIGNLNSTTSLVRKPLKDQDLDNWRLFITGRARDFLNGRAEVDPRDYPKTCERCGLQALCRIEETALLSADESSDGEEDADG
jgi:ATP-dependent helicase/nuclease subunit B